MRRGAEPGRGSARHDGQHTARGTTGTPLARHHGRGRPCGSTVPHGTTSGTRCAAPPAHPRAAPRAGHGGAARPPGRGTAARHPGTAWARRAAPAALCQRRTAGAAPGRGHHGCTRRAAPSVRRQLRCVAPARDGGPGAAGEAGDVGALPRRVCDRDVAIVPSRSRRPRSSAGGPERMRDLAADGGRAERRTETGGGPANRT
jgi:hypothetical protein